MAKKNGFIEIDHGYKKIIEELQNVKGAHVKIGVQAGTEHRNPDGNMDLVQIAATHEFGLRGMPQRSFLFSTMSEKKNEINQFVKIRLGSVIAGRKTIFEALSEVGLRVESMVKDKITRGPFQALSQRTIERKTIQGRKGSTPLIDTGQLRKSIRYVVVNAK